MTLLFKELIWLIFCVNFTKPHSFISLWTITTTKKVPRMYKKSYSRVLDHDYLLSLSSIDKSFLIHNLNICLSTDRQITICQSISQYLGSAPVVLWYVWYVIYVILWYWNMIAVTHIREPVIILYITFSENVYFLWVKNTTPLLIKNTTPLLMATISSVGVQKLTSVSDVLNSACYVQCKVETFSVKVFFSVKSTWLIIYQLKFTGLHFCSGHC